MIGVAYKPDIDDVRESPALDIIALLQEAGANVSYHDPHVASIAVPRGTLTSQPLTQDTLLDSDCVVIATNHSMIDLQQIAQEARLVVDTRKTIKSGIGADSRLLSL